MFHPPKQDESQIKLQGNPIDSGFWRDALARQPWLEPFAQTEAPDGRQHCSKGHASCQCAKVELFPNHGIDGESRKTIDSLVTQRRGDLRDDRSWQGEWAGNKPVFLFFGGSMAAVKSLALVAHDKKKDQLIAWVKAHQDQLKGLELYGTGTTGGRINAETDLTVTALKSGPLGGDAQIGAMISEGRLDALVFFIDPLSAMPHDVDVKSLLRLAILYDTLLAVNEASATAMISAHD